MTETDSEREFEINETAVCDGGTLELKTIADLRRFLREYSDFYDFVRKDSQENTQQPFSEVNNWARTLQQLTNNQNTWDPGNNDRRNTFRQDVRRILNADETICLPHHTSQRAQKIKHVWEQHGTLAGAAAALLASGNSNLEAIWKRSESIKGALAYALADPSLENIAARNAEAGLNDALARFETARGKLYGEVDAAKLDLNEQTEQHDGKFEQMQKSLATLVNGLAEEYERRTTEAINNIRNTEAVYKQHMQLKASRLYWKEKATDHEIAAGKAKKTALIWLVVGGAALSLVLLLLVGSSINSGCDVSSFEVIRKWFLPNTEPLKCPSSELSLWSYAPRAAFGLILTTIFFWIARLLVRLWLSEVHLGIDANERVVMVDSYIALKSEGHVEDSDRFIILAPLFRPTQDGIVKDDAAADPNLFGFMQRASK